MKLTDWFRAAGSKRRADLDGRVLAELRRLGGEGDALQVRGTVRTQYAIVQASLARLEQTGQVTSRWETRPGAAPRQVYTVTGGSLS